jgi:hypothetical protein
MSPYDYLIVWLFQGHLWMPVVVAAFGLTIFGVWFSYFRK